MTPRWPRDGPRRPQDARDGPRWPQDGPKMVPRRPQGDPRIGVSCRRGANFAKSAMPSRIRSPRGPKVALRRLKTAQDEPRWSQDGPRWPEDGLKMEPRWSQDGAKMASKSAPGPGKLCSRIAYGRGWPKIVKIGVSPKRGAIFGRSGVRVFSNLMNKNPFSKTCFCSSWALVR